MPSLYIDDDDLDLESVEFDDPDYLGYHFEPRNKIEEALLEFCIKDFREEHKTGIYDRLNGYQIYNLAQDFLKQTGEIAAKAVDRLEEVLWDYCRAGEEEYRLDQVGCNAHEDLPTGGDDNITARSVLTLYTDIFNGDWDEGAKILGVARPKRALEARYDADDFMGRIFGYCAKRARSNPDLSDYDSHEEFEPLRQAVLQAAHDAN